MSLFLLIFLTLSLIAIVIAALVTIGGLKTKGQIQRALNMSLFLIRVPRDQANNENKQSAKELIAVAEQLFSSFSNMHSKGWNKFLYGEPYIALEVAVHHIGEETHFYMAVPKSSEDIIEKQIYSYYPKAEVSRVTDYNIFNPEGTAAASYLYYEKESILPIRTYQLLESDPLGAILTSMSKLEAEGEGAALQILIRPSHGSQKSLAAKVAREMQAGFSFKEAFSRAKHPPKKKQPETDNQQPAARIATPADQEIIKAITTKAAKQSFDVNIRLLASAFSPALAQQLLAEFEGSFIQFSGPDLNGLKASRLKDKSLRKLIYNFSFRLFSDRQAIVMSTEEIASLYHLPIESTAAPRVKFLKAKPAEPPPDLPSQGIILGRNAFRGQEAKIRMTDEDRRRHLYVIGQTGTGKSTLMKALLRQDIENGNGVCLIDPHGEFAEFVLSVVPSSRAEDVIYFDPGDLERPMGLNMLEIDPARPEQKTMVINELFGIIDKLYNLKETGGPIFEKYFKNSIMLLLDDFQYDYQATGQINESKIPVLADISRVLVDDKFRADKLSRETNPLVREFWQLEAEKAGGEASLANMAPYISSKVDTFVSNEFLRPIINQKRNAFDFRQLMDESKILVVNLSKGKIGDLNANLLGMIIVGKLLMAALSRIDIADEMSRKDFFLYIDEFQNFTTDSISTILSEARKYRLDLIIAHQFIKQLEENIRDAVFGNVGSIVSFRISPDDAEYMKNKFDPVFSPADLMNIDNLNAYVSMLINGRPARPFNIKLETEKVFGVGSAEVAQAVKELSRLKYGRPRQEIEAELMAR